MMRSLVLIFGVLLSSFAYGVEADQTRIKEYELSTITHKEGEVIYATFNFVHEDGTVERMVLPDSHFRRGTTETTFTGPPATYEITIGRPLFVEIVREGQPGPKPRPKPLPVPDDDFPAPPDTTRFEVDRVFFVEEQNDRNINPQYIAYTNVDFQKKLRDKGVKFYIFDDDDPDKNVQDWVKVLDGKLPAVVFYGDAENFKIEALPKDITADSLYSMFEKVAK